MREKTKHVKQIKSQKRMKLIEKCRVLMEPVVNENNEITSTTVKCVTVECTKINGKGLAIVAGTLAVAAGITYGAKRLFGSKSSKNDESHEEEA